MTSRWRTVFWLEVAICAATCASWTLAPDAFLRGALGLEDVDVRHRLLLGMAANVVLCAYVYLYARLLLERPFPRVAFRRLQEAMAIGDVIVLVTSGVQLAYTTPDPLWIGGQIAMAALWLAIRTTWLVQTRRPSAELPAH